MLPRSAPWRRRSKTSEGSGEQLLDCPLGPLVLVCPFTVLLLKCPPTHIGPPAGASLLDQSLFQRNLA